MIPDLSKIRAMAEQATAGPWEYSYENDTGPNEEGFWEWYELTNDNNLPIGSAKIEDNAAYIAAVSPDVVLALLDHIDTLTAKLAEARRVIEPFGKAADLFADHQSGNGFAGAWITFDDWQSEAVPRIHHLRAARQWLQGDGK